MNAEDYVSYELAVKLKEKGFSETTLGKYVDCHKDPTLFHGMFYEPWNIEKDSINAPSLYQAQKWLREEKDIDIIVFPRWDSIKNKFYYFAIRGYRDEIINDNQHYTQYEESLSAGITKALELI